MTLRTIIAVAVAALVIGAGAIGAAAAAPDQAQNDDHPDGHAPEHVGQSDERGHDAVRDDNSSESSDAGPPVDMPDPVPAHVEEIHRTIGDFLAGALNGSLGDAVSAITPGDSNASAADGSGDAGDAGDAQAGESGANASSESRASKAAGSHGPPSDLPAVVPDRVGAIHDAIGSFLDGAIDSLGDAVSGAGQSS